jgi:hypothetical protein
MLNAHQAAGRAAEIVGTEIVSRTSLVIRLLERHPSLATELTEVERLHQRLGALATRLADFAEDTE